jgi:hypothetical protein
LPKATIVYQCPECAARFLGEQRCGPCGVYCRRLGPGGPCPHCDDVVAIVDLLAGFRSPMTITMHNTELKPPRRSSANDTRAIWRR